MKKILFVTNMELPRTGMEVATAKIKEDIPGFDFFDVVQTDDSENWGRFGKNGLRGRRSFSWPGWEQGFRVIFCGKWRIFWCADGAVTFSTSPIPATIN